MSEEKILGLITRSTLQRKVKDSKWFWKVVEKAPGILFQIKDDSLLRDDDGIPIWNRTKSSIFRRLFADDNTNPHLKTTEKREIRDLHYAYYPAGRKYNPDIVSGHEEINIIKPICGIQEFFGEGKKLLDLACGGGDAAIGIAKEYPGLEVVGVDRAFGNEIPLRKTRLTNLYFKYGDWNDLQFENETFDRIVSDQGVGVYGRPDIVAKEITRIAKLGCILRGTIGKQIIGRKGFHFALVEKGWDVYKYGDLIIGIYQGIAFQLKD